MPLHTLLFAHDPAHRQQIEHLLATEPVSFLDLFQQQWLEWYKLAHPGQRLSPADLQQAYQAAHPNGHSHVGTLVYYPWRQQLIHILPEEQFVAVRTNRNVHKITPAELASLRTRKVGIIGLSVGAAVAVTMAQERMCGELRLADFDTLELSNLNRIRTGIFNLGVNKAVATAREIAELDPYLKVTCYTDGFTQENAEDFLEGAGGKLDLLVDECDGLESKFLCRYIARHKHIPVLMETSDRGMLDVERFDVEPARPIFHGSVAEETVAAVQALAPAQRLALVWQIIDGDNISERLKLSFAELGKTISTWPQLASSVAMGGAVVTDVARRLLLGHEIASGRYYIDLDKLVPATTVVEGS